VKSRFRKIGAAYSETGPQVRLWLLVCGKGVVQCLMNYSSFCSWSRWQ